MNFVPLRPRVLKIKMAYAMGTSVARPSRQSKTNIITSAIIGMRMVLEISGIWWATNVCVMAALSSIILRSLPVGFLSKNPSGAVISFFIAKRRRSPSSLKATIWEQARAAK